MANKKFSNQRVGLFKVIQKVGWLAYKLKLPPVMKIYPVVSIAQLELVEKPDPYNQTRLDHLGPVEIEQMTSNGVTCSEQPDGISLNNAYKVEKILGKRIKKYGKGNPKTEYRVK